MLARETYYKYKESAIFKQVAKKFLKLLRKVRTPERWAKIFQREVQSYVDEVVENLDHPELIQCKKGCSACCYTQVSVTAEEASLYAQKILKSEVKIDRARLREQAYVGNDAKKWYQLDYKKRACVFLADDQSCLIYEDRPSVCRTNFALSDPYYCETKDGQEKAQRLLLTVKADLTIAVAFDEARGAGALPYMVNEAISGQLSLLNYARA